MKRYARLYNNKIIDVGDKNNNKNYVSSYSEGYYFTFEDDKLLGEKYYEGYGKGGMWVEEAKIRLIGIIKKESDNIVDLLEVGDLIEFQVNGKRAGIVEVEEYNLINSHDEETITKIYTKQGDNYILEWRK